MCEPESTPLQAKCSSTKVTMPSEKAFEPPDLAPASSSSYESRALVQQVALSKKVEFANHDDHQSEDNDGDKQCCCKNYLGIIYTLGAGFIFTVGGLIVKMMKDFHPISLALYRFQGVLLPALALALYAEFVKKTKVFGAIWPLTDKAQLKLLLFASARGILGGFALICLFSSMHHLTLADALVIHSCRPVFVAFFAYLFLGEACGVFPVCAALLTIVGVGVIARPPMLTGEESFDANTLRGTAYGVGGMLTTALSMVVLRYVRGLHISLVTLSFGVWGTIVNLAGAAIIQRFDVPTKSIEILYVFCLAVVTFFAQVGITMAMKYEQASAVAIVRTFDTIYAFVLQFIVFGTVPDIYSLGGAALIIFCVLMIAFRKWVSTLPEKHSARNRFWFVLR